MSLEYQGAHRRETWSLVFSGALVGVCIGSWRKRELRRETYPSNACHLGYLVSRQPYPTPTFIKPRFELSTCKNLSCKREAPDTDFLVPEAACVRELWMYCRFDLCGFRFSYIVCFRIFFLPFFRSFGHSFLFSFLDRNIYLRGASSIGTLRHEIFSLDMEKGSKSQTLVWCENCTEKFTKSRGRRNCQSNGWLLNLFSNRFSLLRAMCKYFFLVLTELSY